MCKKETFTCLSKCPFSLPSSFSTEDTDRHSCWRKWNWISRKGDTQESPLPWELSLSYFPLHEGPPFACTSGLHTSEVKLPELWSWNGTWSPVWGQWGFFCLPWLPWLPFDDFPKRLYVYKLTHGQGNRTEQTCSLQMPFKCLDNFNNKIRNNNNAPSDASVLPLQKNTKCIQKVIFLGRKSL